MKLARWLGTFALIASSVLAAAQAPGPAPTNAAPRRSGPPPVRSPEVDAGRHVTFRLRAPQAHEVIVNGQWPDGRVPMTMETNGVWTTTVGPVAPGVWEYSFVVDGLTLIDPGNPAIKPMREPRTSILHLPDQPPQPHDFQDIPHGVVRFHTYASKSLGRLRDLAVYTPPGYDRRSTRFPTLYLQHGSGDNHATWIVHGKAHWILDHLIATRRATPMMVVMMDGHAAVPGAVAGATNNTALFERDLLEDVLPFIEANYRVKAGTRHRAIAGLSMGGGQSLNLGLNHQDLFAWVAGFSASVPTEETVVRALDQAEATNRQLRLLWIACGRDDFLLRRNEEFIALLNSRQVRHEWLLTEGNHSWPVWRRYLADFAPRLFR